MADLPKDTPVESGEIPIMAEGTSPQTNDIDNATAVDESTSGQSDTNQGKGISVGAKADISQPSHEHEHEHDQTEPGGDGEATNDTSHDVPEGIPASDGDKAGGATDAGSQPGAESEPKKKKKRSKNKKQGAAARKGVTGFEEFYADAPITPAEAALEKNEIYAESRPFSERIEQCIQRYRASRRMDSERTMLFNKYLWLGGIDASPRQFTGFAEDREALAEADAEEIRQMTATDFVGGGGGRFYNPAEPDNWVVDFDGIARGFLSRVVPSIYMYDEEANKLAAKLVKNFLNYVAMHDVCPKYKDNIELARILCDYAPSDLRYAHELLLEMPGNFNTLCKELFCDGEIYKVQGELKGELYDKVVVFRVAVLTSAQEWIQKRLMRSNNPTATRIISTYEETYKVHAIRIPHPSGYKIVAEELEAAGHKGKGKPCGLLQLKRAIIGHGYNNVLRPDQFNTQNWGYQEFLLEEELLKKMKKGMKIKAVICELNIGLRFIKEVKDIRVSWDVFLPQMLMEGWKDPVPNERPPPSVSHPDAEDKAMAAEFAVDDPKSS
ncbi:Argonaute siRNA chaperone complex subunit Arb1-domain-containing protein [Annulohypoxylon truncatum]|uniref:Argonaute siRNA chaperone complex subunit Arb1-domain-containing protein n=1 Tax=Annulohypoxylon truncatum TaxID=327061 RepID=UPI002008D309|nr:Argonaute siRNA chaperone complex subunit Arb1-domain-containing protein [Annulohypoxylon truncatum]KAI1208409.1 Argonaute siRNA chaperone complex subunit Arb1-domain-containing protein [Annulohypoxylon truncatum]